MDDEAISSLAAGLNGWGNVDAFARSLSGPAWAHGLVSDNLIEGWSRDADRWLRRTALVSTVALNRPADGGKGDAPRTLAICSRLVNDHDDMIEKALSWALRELGKRDTNSVKLFLAEFEDQLGARVRREVANKLVTGLKNPRGGRATL